MTECDYVIFVFQRDLKLAINDSTTKTYIINF